MKFIIYKQTFVVYSIGDSQAWLCSKRDFRGGYSNAKAMQYSTKYKSSVKLCDDPATKQTSGLEQALNAKQCLALSSMHFKQCFG